MTGYTSKWNCRICKEPQDTDGVPKNQVCYKCLLPVANMLCREIFKVDLQAGIDSTYFTRRAESYIDALMRKWKRE